MTNPPGDGPTPPEEPREQPQPGAGQPPGQQPPPSDQPGYWEQQARQQQPGYPPYYPQGAPMQFAPDHPKATTSLVLGILGVVLCQIIAPFAWAMGKRTMDEIDASQGRFGGRGAAQAGYILGIVGTVLLALSVIFIVLYVVFAVAIIGGGIATS
ncbi:MAG TPA: DUF4190 domain-containing protein [Nocardioidaceae bacterium]|nr:DUF4190 domain-containing protein [Nocardioidaceae bacterium]